MRHHIRCRHDFVVLMMTGTACMHGGYMLIQAQQIAVQLLREEQLWLESKDLMYDCRG